MNHLWHDLRYLNDYYQTLIPLNYDGMSEFPSSHHRNDIIWSLTLFTFLYPVTFIRCWCGSWPGFDHRCPASPVECKVNSGTCPHVIHINKQVTPAPVIGWTTSIFDHSIGWYITNWVEILFSLNKHSPEVTPHHITKC